MISTTQYSIHRQKDDDQTTSLKACPLYSCGIAWQGGDSICSSFAELTKNGHQPPHKRELYYYDPIPEKKFWNDPEKKFWTDFLETLYASKY